MSISIDNYFQSLLIRDLYDNRIGEQETPRLLVLFEALLVLLEVLLDRLVLLVLVSKVLIGLVLQEFFLLFR